MYGILKIKNNKINSLYKIHMIFVHILTLFIHLLTKINYINNKVKSHSDYTNISNS